MGEAGDVELRPATVHDVPAVLAFWAAAAHNDARPADTTEAVRRLIERDPDALTVAVVGSELVGTLISGYDGWRCHLYRLAVSPTHRRRGVARALLEAAEARFRALGATRVDAMVLDDNDLGQQIWTAAGYHRQDDWRRWVRPLTP